MTAVEGERDRFSEICPTLTALAIFEVNGSLSGLIALSCSLRLLPLALALVAQELHRGPGVLAVERLRHA